MNVNSNPNANYFFTLTLGLALRLALNRIHERALDLVEDDDAEEEQDAHEGEGVGEGCPGEVALTEGGVFEGLDNGGHGVGKDEGAEGAFGNHAEGIDDGGAVHPELDDEGEEDAEVTVFGGHGGYQDAKAQAESGKHDNKDGEQQDGPVGTDVAAREEEPEVEGDE